MTRMGLSIHGLYSTIKHFEGASMVHPPPEAAFTNPVGLPEFEMRAWRRVERSLHVLCDFWALVLQDGIFGRDKLWLASNL